MLSPPAPRRHRAMTDQIHRIADKPPVFPCWLRERGSKRWYRFQTPPLSWVMNGQDDWYDAWSPDYPTAPEVRPDRYSPFEEPLEYHASIAGGKHDDDAPPASTPSPAAIAEKSNTAKIVRDAALEALGCALSIYQHGDKID